LEALLRLRLGAGQTDERRNREDGEKGGDDEPQGAEVTRIHERQRHDEAHDRSQVADRKSQSRHEAQLIGRSDVRQVRVVIDVRDVVDGEDGRDDHCGVRGIREIVQTPRQDASPLRVHGPQNGVARVPSLVWTVPSTCWTVYLLRCRDGSLYTGITNDLARRL